MIKKLTILILWLLPLTTMAETLYVGDTLRVGVRPEPTKSVPSISVITTGAAVEMIEQKNSYAKIRTKSGVEGWVKSAYLTRKTPANKKLKAANKKIKKLEKQLGMLQQDQGSKADKAKQKLQATIQQLQKEKANMLEEINNLKTQSPSSTLTTTQQIKNTSINLKNLNKELVYLFLGGIVILLILGFFFGVSWYKQQVTKRLGGLSI